MSHPVTTQETGYCPGCGMNVEVVTNGATDQYGEEHYEVVCLNGHVIEEG